MHGLIHAVMTLILKNSLTVVLNNMSSNSLTTEDHKTMSEDMILRVLFNVIKDKINHGFGNVITIKYTDLVRAIINENKINVKHSEREIIPLKTYGHVVRVLEDMGLITLDKKTTYSIIRINKLNPLWLSIMNNDGDEIIEKVSKRIKDESRIRLRKDVVDGIKTIINNGDADNHKTIEGYVNYLLRSYIKHYMRLRSDKAIMHENRYYTVKCDKCGYVVARVHSKSLFTVRRLFNSIHCPQCGSMVFTAVPDGSY